MVNNNFNLFQKHNKNKLFHKDKKIQINKMFMKKIIANKYKIINFINKK